MSSYVSSSSSLIPSISRENLSGFEPTPDAMKSANYAFIKGPEELTGKKIDDPVTQQIILEWLEKERSKGHKLVGAFETSLTWLFEVTPLSIRFIRDEF